jgi:hypothetical protein
MWVTAILTRYLHESYGIVNAWNASFLRGYFILIFGLGLWTLILEILNFQHLIPKKLAFWVSSSLPTNILAYFIIVIVIGRIPLDWSTFWASLILFCFVALVFWVYKKSITPAKSALPTLKKHEEMNKKEVRTIKRKVKNFFMKHFPFFFKKENFPVKKKKYQRNFST